MKNLKSIQNLKKKIELAMALLLIAAAFIIARQSADFATSRSVMEHTPCIVIDAGHGGDDPGKVGINNALEKDINLSIALQLKEALEKEKQLSVILTRETDCSLADSGVKNQKVSDMQNRCQLISDSNPLFTVSIHQNSYTTPDIKGAQVFYYGQSAEGKLLAETLQNSLVKNVDPDNHRLARANESYYLLKKTPTPTVIVECGFLSNPGEADLLLTADYQQKLVDALYQGIKEYLASSKAVNLPTEKTDSIPTTEADE